MSRLDPNLILALFIKGLNKTIRLKLVNFSLLQPYLEQRKPLIYAFWEGREFLLLGCHQDTNLAVMASASKDGILISGILKHLNFYPIVGSSSRKAVSGLIGMIKAMKTGRNACFVVDGPRGPIYKVKPGIVYLASKTKSTIIPLTTKAKYSYTFKNSWCKYEIPLPFSPAVMIIGQPMQIPHRVDRKIIEQKRSELEDSLLAITKRADLYYKKNR